MSAEPILKRPDVSDSERRSSQLRFLCQFLDVFASADPIMRAAATQYVERLRAEDCDGDEIIRIAATALLVAVEQEIDQKALVLERLPPAWRDVSVSER